jgi:6-pyruvoyl-tetrahydropterin synthase
MDIGRTWAKVTTTFEAIHHWKDAFDEVEFLKHPHRHTFHVTVAVEQTHDDRDIEYINFKRELNAFLEEYGDERADGRYLADKSCEMMATDIIEWVEAYIGTDGTTREIHVTVTEDGENGALVEGTIGSE